MSLISALFRGADGLAASAKGLSVAANNVANINTQGYARQQAIFASLPGLNGDLTENGGVEVASVQSVVSPFVEAQLFQTSNAFGTYDGRRDTVNQLETLWTEADKTGMGTAIDDYFGKWNDLATRPGDVNVRAGLKESGNYLALRFNELSSQLNQMRVSLSSQIGNRLTTINQLAQQVASYNQQINSSGGPTTASDLVAMRQDTLRQLSEEANVSYFQTSDGSVQVQIAGGTSLVSGFTAGSLSMTDNQGYGGQAAILVQLPGSTNTLDVTAGLTSGRLGGNLIDRNTTINTQISGLDTLAYGIANQVNSLHSKGYNLNNTTGNNFFAQPSQVQNAAQNMALDSSILLDAKNIASATNINSPGDNGTALAIAKLQGTPLLNSNTQTFSQYYQGLVSAMGSTASSVLQQYTSQNNLLAKVKISRDQVSAVNMDEEGSDLIRFQKAYQASSKVMSIADQMLEDLLKI